MARPIRIEFEGAIYYLMSRGNGRLNIFRGVRDRFKFLELLGLGVKRYGVVVHAYVLMDNHFHLIVETPKSNLSRWMQWLLTSHTVWFNTKHETVGHLFQGRFKSVLVEPGPYLLELSRYIHLNPVRGTVLGRGSLAEKREKLRRFVWSSYRAYAGLCVGPGWLERSLILGECGSSAGGRRIEIEYRRFVEEGLLREIEDPEENAHCKQVLGSESFHRRVADHLALLKDSAKQSQIQAKEREYSGLKSLKIQQTPQSVLERIAKAQGVSLADLQSGKVGIPTVNRAMLEIRQNTDATLREIGELFGGLHYQTVAQRLHRLRSKAGD